MAANRMMGGLLDELGLGAVNEQQAFQAGTGGNPFQSQNGSVGAFMNLGRQLGQQIGPGVAGLISGIQNRGNGNGFLANMNQGAVDQRDAVIARGMGLPSVQALRQRRKVREEVTSVSVAPTGDPLADQDAALKQIIDIATRNGDTETALKATQKRMQLKRQMVELEKLERANRSGARDEQIEIEDDSTGRTVIMQGDDLDDAHSKATMNDDGTWTVVRPDGSVRQNVPGIQLTMVNPAARSSQRVRQFETPEGQMKAALALNGQTGQSISKTRNSVADAAEQAGIVTDMTNTLMGMYNPEVAFSDSAALARGSDRVITFAETMSTMLSRSGDNSPVEYNGSRVSPDRQHQLATDERLFNEYLSENGLQLRDILPEHMQNDTKASQLFRANIMQLAYLDARLQEPANRGLSDSDIKNALARIGAGSPNPTVFANRQRELLNRLQSRVANLGIEFARTSQVSKQQIIDHVYTPESVARVTDKLAEAQDNIDRFLAGEGEESGGFNFDGRSTEDLEKRLRELEQNGE